MRIIFQQNALADVMTACTSFVSKEDRPTLKLIQLKCENGTCLATALNGFIARAITIPYESGDEGTYYIPALKITKQRYPVDSVIIEKSEDEKSVTVSIGNTATTYSIPEGKFTDVTEYFSSDKPVYECAFEVGRFIDLLKGFNRKDKIIFESYGNMKPHVIKKSNADGNYALIIPLRMADRKGAANNEQEQEGND